MLVIEFAQALGYIIYISNYCNYCLTGPWPDREQACADFNNAFAWRKGNNGMNGVFSFVRKTVRLFKCKGEQQTYRCHNYNLHGCMDCRLVTEEAADGSQVLLPSKSSLP